MFQPYLDVHTTGEGVNRRALLKQLVVGSTGLAALNWRQVLAAQASELKKHGKRMILLWMDGGPSQFETFNPKVGSPNQGPVKAIPSALSGVHVGEHWPETAKVMDKIALIRSMSTRESDHFRAIKLMRTGYKINPTIAYPTWGSIVSMTRYDQQAEIPAYVRVGKPRIKTRDVNSGILGPRHASFNVDEPGKYPANVRPTVSAEVMRRRLALAQSLDQQFAAAGGGSSVREKREIYERTSRFVLSKHLDVFDLSKETDKLRDAYGRSSFGQGCLLARRLIETGVHFVEVFSWGSLNDQGWDTHKRGFAENPLLANETDAGYATLLRDLQERGLLEDTLVVWMGEFGRTPKFKKDGGRDHYAKGWNLGISGAGVKVGQVIGATDKNGVEVTDRPIGVADLFVSFCKVLGIDPHDEYHTDADQPHQFVKGGKLINELF
jgi:hypothetical protein